MNILHELDIPFTDLENSYFDAFKHLLRCIDNIFTITRENIVNITLNVFNSYGSHNRLQFTF